MATIITNKVTERGESIITHINMCLMLRREFGINDVDMYIGWNMGYLTTEEMVYLSDYIEGLHADGAISVN